MFGQYKRLRNEFTGVLTGKGISFGGLQKPDSFFEYSFDNLNNFSFVLGRCFFKRAVQIFILVCTLLGNRFQVF